MRSVQFAAYLAAVGAHGVAGYAEQVEAVLGLNLDNADLGPAGIDGLIARLLGATGTPDEAAARTALRAYGSFLEYYRAR